MFWTFTETAMVSLARRGTLQPATTVVAHESAVPGVVVEVVVDVPGAGTVVVVGGDVVVVDVEAGLTNIRVAAATLIGSVTTATLANSRERGIR
jgi:hypothetical protein